MDARQKTDEIVKSAKSKKAFDIAVIDVTERASVCDYFVVASASNVIQTNAIAEKIAEDLEKLGEGPLRVEGSRGAKWIAMDFSDVIVHIFERETRDDYNFESLWNNGRNLTREAE